MMTVQQLIDLLSKQDPTADVHLMSQQNWPFENAILGVAVRKDWEDVEEDEDGNPTPGMNGGRGGKSKDVFLVEGHQIRYGSRKAWEHARRR